MNEKFLHFIWKNKLFETENIKTVNGKALQIIETGEENTNAGPDFLNSKIKINNTLWAGNIEIHINSADWYKHNHNADKAYDNVILHVVLKFDKKCFRMNGTEIPVFEIQFKNRIFENYNQILHSDTWIPCQNRFHEVDYFTKIFTLNSLLIERLEERSEIIWQYLNQTKLSWEESFYRLIARSFGFKLNSFAFEKLAESLPIRILSKHKNNLFQIEALIFGQAGFLSEIFIDDDYYNDLKKEFEFLKDKYQLKPLEKHLWRFLRLRPNNFPTIRLAQFAMLIRQSTALFSKILEITDYEELIKLFMIEPSDYWKTHYLFAKESKASSKKIGLSAIQNIILNSVIPVMFVYGKWKNLAELTDRTLLFLEDMPPENNSIIKNWSALGLPAENAYNSQALLQLKNQYCSKKKCLNCKIGIKILKD